MPRRFSRRFRSLLALVASVALVIIALLFARVGPFRTNLAELAPRYARRSVLVAAPAPTGSIRVMTWNIKFGGARLDFFFDCHGNRILMRESEVRSNLDAIANAIRHFDPDVVLLQEVDASSTRSANMNELRYLLEHTDLNYGVYAPTRAVDVVPGDSMDAFDTGNALLSRWPMHDARVVELGLRTGRTPLERDLSSRRTMLVAATDVPGGRPLTLVNLHADAYGRDGTKLRHIQRFERELRALDASGFRFVAGGDLNALPPGTAELSGFPDSVCTDEDYIADDYSREVGILDRLHARYEPAITTARYVANQASFFSHTVDGRGYWNRTLDYLFTNGDFVDETGAVHQGVESGGVATMPLSDHAPITVELSWP